jgi:hypothetical protein
MNTFASCKKSQIMAKKKKEAPLDGSAETGGKRRGLTVPAPFISLVRTRILRDA